MRTAAVSGIDPSSAKCAREQEDRSVIKARPFCNLTVPMRCKIEGCRQMTRWCTSLRKWLDAASSPEEGSEEALRNQTSTGVAPSIASECVGLRFEKNCKSS